MNINSIVPAKNIGEFFETIGLVGDLTRSAGDRSEASAKINKVMGAFMRRPEKQSRRIAQASMASSDIPVAITNNAQIFQNEGNFDLVYEQAFDTVSLEPDCNFWEIEDMTNGLTFRKVAEGGRLRVEGLSATIAMVRTDKYGGAMGWTDEMIRNRRFPAMEAKAKYFRNREASAKAERHYKLLAAAATNTTAYSGTGSTERAKDINTINDGALSLANRLKDTYVGDPLMNEILVIAKPEMWSRINAALRETTQAVAGQPSLVPFNMKLGLTFSDFLTNEDGGSTVTDALFVLPGYKNQKATTREPTSFFEYDMLTDSYVQAVWTNYGAAAEANQIEKVSFA